MVRKNCLPVKIKKGRLRIKNKKIKALLTDGGRNNAKEDFLELLKRSVHP
jgi:hypothetical protein